MTVLVLEDNSNISKLLHDLLVEHKLSVVIAPDIKSAKTWLPRINFGGIITDWNLPDGIASDIFPVEKLIPTILLTGHDIEDIDKSWRDSCVEVLEKPSTFHKIVKAIEEYFIEKTDRS